MRFTEEFKIEAARQITEQRHQVADVAEQLRGGSRRASFSNVICFST